MAAHPCGLSDRHTGPTENTPLAPTGGGHFGVFRSLRDRFVGIPPIDQKTNVPVVMLIGSCPARTVLANRTYAFALDRTYREVHVLVGFVKGIRLTFKLLNVSQKKIGKHGP